MPDYSNSKIYRLVCNITGEEYIGSTTTSLSTRKSKHVWDAKHSTKPCKSKQIVERDDFDIILIETFSCNSKEELKARERFHIQRSDNCINIQRPLRTYREWYLDTREKRLEIRRQYRQNRKKQENTFPNLKQDRLQRQREYHQTRREQDRTYKNTKFVCEICKGSYTRANKSQHCKTKKHLSFIKSDESS